MLQVSLDLFRLDVGRYPSTNEGLDVLIFRPDEIYENIWKGPYLPKNKLPKDPWENDYIYAYDAHNNRVLLYSYGQDGESKSAGNDFDDINNWDESRKWDKKPIDKELLFFLGLIILIIINAYLLKKQKRKLIHNQEAQVDSQGTRVLNNRDS